MLRIFLLLSASIALTEPKLRFEFDCSYSNPLPFVEVNVCSSSTLENAVDNLMLYKSTNQRDDNHDLHFTGRDNQKIDNFENTYTKNWEEYLAQNTRVHEGINLDVLFEINKEAVSIWSDFRQCSKGRQKDLLALLQNNLECENKDFKSRLTKLKSNTVNLLKHLSPKAYASPFNHLGIINVESRNRMDEKFDQNFNDFIKTSVAIGETNIEKSNQDIFHFYENREKILDTLLNREKRLPNIHPLLVEVVYQIFFKQMHKIIKTKHTGSWTSFINKFVSKDGRRIKRNELLFKSYQFINLLPKNEYSLGLFPNFSLIGFAYYIPQSIRLRPSRPGLRHAAYHPVFGHIRNSYGDNRKVINSDSFENHRLDVEYSQLPISDYQVTDEILFGYMTFTYPMSEEEMLSYYKNSFIETLGFYNKF